MWTCVSTGCWAQEAQPYTERGGRERGTEAHREGERERRGREDEGGREGE